MLHGGDLTAAAARHGGRLEEWLDLSTGINPHAWPLPAIPDRFWRALPSAGDQQALLAAARMAYRIPDGVGLLAAPGTQALIQWLPRLLPPGGMAVLGPTYAEHAIAARAAGREVREISDLGDWTGDGHLVIVNPNNPDGRLLPPERIAGLAEIARRRGRWLILDESFMDVTPEATAAELCADFPVVILRSFGKFYGLAGVRLGFLAGPERFTATVRQALGPWAVAGPALAIGRAALADEGWSAAMRRRLAAEADALDAVLAAAGLSIVGGTTLYRLARRADAAELHGFLASRRIWVRRFDWESGLLRFGLPGGPAGLQRLDQALREAG